MGAASAPGRGTRKSVARAGARRRPGGAGQWPRIAFGAVELHASPERPAGSRRIVAWGAATLAFSAVRWGWLSPVVEARPREFVARERLDDRVVVAMLPLAWSLLRPAR